MAIKAGPKRAAISDPLDFVGDDFDSFAERFLRVPKGRGRGEPFELLPFQREMLGTLFDDDVSQLVAVIPRGNGKSGLAAAVALHHFFTRVDAPRVLLVAQDQGSANRLLSTCVSMLAMSEPLHARAKIYTDRIVTPFNDGELVALPATPSAIEGSDCTFVIADEIGYMSAEVFEAALLSLGKREGTKLLAIGTPSTAKFRNISPLWRLREQHRAGGTPPGMRFMEWGAADDADIYAPASWHEANPASEAHGGWLTDKAIEAQLPPLTRETEFRRARLGQWVQASTDVAFAEDAWRECARPGVTIPEGSRVVVGVDGSYSGDATAVVVASVSQKPHIEVGGYWEPSGDDGVVPVLEVEDYLRELCDRYRVVELVFDPYRWARTMQALEDEGLPVAAFPQSPRRLTPATVELRAAVNNGLLTHADDSRLNEHAFRAVLEESRQGIKLSKPSKNERIDLMAALIMAYSRANWLARPKAQRKKQIRSYRRG